MHFFAILFIFSPPPNPKSAIQFHVCPANKRQKEEAGEEAGGGEKDISTSGQAAPTISATSGRMEGGGGNAAGAGIPFTPSHPPNPYGGSPRPLGSSPPQFHWTNTYPGGEGGETKTLACGRQTTNKQSGRSAGHANSSRAGHGQASKHTTGPSSGSKQSTGAFRLKGAESSTRRVS